MKIAIALLAYTLSVAEKQQPTLDLIFAHARAKRIAELVALSGSDTVRGSSLHSSAVNVALYIVDPKNQRDRFVQAFPQTAGGVMNDLYEGIELRNYTPEFLFSFKSLGEIARKGGSRLAAQRLAGAVMVSDGVVSEQLCEDFNALLQQRPRNSLYALVALSDGRRELYSSCFGALDPVQRQCILGRLQALALTDEKEREVAREVQSALSNP